MTVEPGRREPEKERPLTRLEYAFARIGEGWKLARETWCESRAAGVLVALLVAFFCPFVFVQAFFLGSRKNRSDR